MSESRRVQRVEKELREIIASYIIRHWAQDMLNVGQVIISKDLRQGKVYISAIGSPRVSEEKLSELQQHSAEIQQLISKKLRMKYCPKLKFFNDDSVERNRAIDEIISKIKS